MLRFSFAVTFGLSLLAQADGPAARGFVPLWNGVDLAGWHGQRHFDPYKLAAMPADARAKLRAEDDATMRAHWSVQAGELVNDGHGAYLTTDRAYGDAEFLLEYKTVALADSGIYLRGCPQVQIWDFTEAGGKWNLGADKGSGGLWNNEKHPRFPPQLADRPFGEWNRLAIRQIGERVWVTLNDVVTVDGAVMENFWNRKLPLPARGPLQLQTHGGEIRFRNLWVRDIPADEANTFLQQEAADGFAPIFDGKTLAGWLGATDDYEVVDGAIRCKPGRGGQLFTATSYRDFIVRLQFRLPPGGNNGLALRYPGSGEPAYTGIELQVLDDTAEKYAKLEDYQYHGSVYGVAPSVRGYLRPVGEWNFQEVEVRGTRYVVRLNGTTILDADVQGMASKLKEHVGKDRVEGHFGFAGHSDAVSYRALTLKLIP